MFMSFRIFWVQAGLEWGRGCDLSHQNLKGFRVGILEVVVLVIKKEHYEFISTA
jgi:hypothetical protein